MSSPREPSAGPASQRKGGQPDPPLPPQGPFCGERILEPPAKSPKTSVRFGRRCPGKPRPKFHARSTLAPRGGAGTAWTERPVSVTWAVPGLLLGDLRPLYGESRKLRLHHPRGRCRDPHRSRKGPCREGPPTRLLSALNPGDPVAWEGGALVAPWPGCSRGSGEPGRSCGAAQELSHWGWGAAGPMLRPWLCQG